MMSLENSANVEAAGTTRSGTAKRRLRFSMPLLALCFAFIMVRLPFMFTVPMVEAPDEFAHFWVLKFMRDYLRLPGAAEVAAGGPSAVYGSLPQLGYLPHVAIGLATPVHDISLFARFGSLLMGLVLLYASYQIGRLIFRDNRLLAFALPATIVFHPQLAFLHSYSNSDSTATALGAVILLLALRGINTGITVARCALIGVLMGWLALSKYSGLGVMPAIAFTLVASAVLNRQSVTKVVAALGACGAAAAAVSGWWFVRNYYEYNHDFMGTQTMYRSWATTFHREMNYSVPASHIIKSLRWWRMMFFSFWGLFGYMNKYLWRPVYFVYLGYLIAATVGGAKLLFAFAREKMRAMSRQDWESSIAWTCMALTVVLNLAAMIWASTKNLGGPQGRYLFPSEIPVIALLLLGMSGFGSRWSRVLVGSFIGFNVVVCLGSWLWLFSMYGFHARPL
jgi:hypothetical protein